MIKKITIAAVALTIGSGAAYAAMHGGKDFFSRIDADENGVISKAEAEAMGTARFTRMDADKSGTLTVDELGRMHGMRGGHGGGYHGEGPRGEGGPGKNWVDKGGDGSNRDARIEKRFEMLDADGNGAVTLEEMKAAADARTQKREERRAARFAELDADGNGEITQAEFVSQNVDRMFARLDTDKSGDITKDEMLAAHKAMYDARKAGKPDQAE